MKLTSFEMVLSTGETKVTQKESKEFEIPKPNRKNTGRKYNSISRVTYGKWWYDTLFNNEVAAIQGQAKINSIIQKEYLTVNPSDRGNFKRYCYTVGTFRKKYNYQKLFQAQPTTYIVSFQYDEQGYIVVGGNYPTTYMFFQDCYQRCLNLQIADPRFVPEEYIVALRDKQNQGEWLDWTVPTQTTIQRLCTRFQLDDLYNSMKFPMGWTREETPNDFEPLTDY